MPISMKCIKGVSPYPNLLCVAKVATAALRRKKMHETELNKLSGTRLQLELQVNTLESANLNAETMAAMKKGSDALKVIHNGMCVAPRLSPWSCRSRADSLTMWRLFRTPERVEDTMNEINAQREVANEISDAISNPLYSGLELDEVSHLYSACTVIAVLTCEQSELQEELAQLEQEDLDARLNLPDHVPVHTPVGPSRVTEGTSKSRLLYLDLVVTAS